MHIRMEHLLFFNFIVVFRFMCFMPLHIFTNAQLRLTVRLHVAIQQVKHIYCFVIIIFTAITIEVMMMTMVMEMTILVDK